MKISKKGFTLIELLIVIAIIGILAVAFLPTLLGAPAKGRDTARIADLQKMQKIVVDANLQGKAYPSGSGKIDANLATGYAAPQDKWPGAFEAALGGTLPTDPTSGQFYYYLAAPTIAGNKYAFAMFAQVEIPTNANATCTPGAAPVVNTVGPPAAAPVVPVVYCKAILIQ